jgi:hypothetical protein
MTPLKISMEQMIALHGFFAEAAAVGEASLVEVSGCETEVEVLEIRCSTLGEFGESGMRLTEDLVAGVMGRLEGAVPGSLDLVLEPEEALVWVQAVVGGAGPIETFVTLGREFLAGIAVALSEVLETPTEFHGARLVEEPELAMLVQTHAPLDTLVFSARLRIDVRDDMLTAHSHLLVEPKYLALLLSALSAAVH